MLLDLTPVTPRTERTYQRLKVTDRIALNLVERDDFFQVFLNVTYEGGNVTRYPVTGEVSDGEILSNRMYDIAGAVRAMLEAGFILPPAPKVA